MNRQTFLKKHVFQLLSLALLSATFVNCPGDGALFNTGGVASVSVYSESTVSTTDQDCDGITDSQDSEVSAENRIPVFLDQDNDGIGSTQALACLDASSNPPEGYVFEGGDCNDNDSTVSPQKFEIAENTIDDDCDGEIDEAEDCNTLATYYRDYDNDGFGSADTNAETQMFSLCDEVEAANQGFQLTNTDCDENDPNINPGARELFGDGIDQNCQEDYGLIRYTKYTDSNNDGTPNIAVITSYNEYGDENLVQSDAPVDGLFEIEDYKTYYNDGNLESRIRITSSVHAKMVYSDYDEFDNVQTETHYNFNSSTASFDLYTTLELDYTYNEQNDITITNNTITMASSALTSELNTEKYYSYTEDGLIQNYGYDFGRDGTIDEAYSYEYNEDGLVTVEKHDSDGDTDTDGDGLPDDDSAFENTKVYTYENNLVATESYFEGTNSTATYTIYYTYDAHGTLESSFQDDDGDGVGDSNFVTTEIMYHAAE